ncbi:MAG: cytidine deaminase [Firmicutes bacterium]|nr:cytidine deaminase [Bacillota bacterium]
MDEQTATKLLHYAEAARAQAYVPYSHFAVGAAVLTTEGKIFSGCNIENAAYSATVCAERTALFKAVSEGEHHFSGLAVIADSKDPVVPCGVCRQVLAAWLSPQTPVLLANTSGLLRWTTMEALLPMAFTTIG